jgi:hypothetical protein
LLFVRNAPGALSMLLKQLDETIAKNKPADPRGIAVFLTDDKKATEAKLRDLTLSAKLSNDIPLVIPEDPNRLKPYKLHPDAELTVVLYRRYKVLGNFAFKKGEFKESDVAPIAAALVKILPSPEELAKEIKADKEAELKRKAAAEAKAKQDADAKKKAEAEAKAKQEADVKAKKDAAKKGS